ncbi:MAG: hypothetical protein VYE26_01340 [Pseudomonadota bacterium]|jgi:hypothetical protein|nr:hypothetical protein [Pseudomonadota bacterium]
MNLIRDELLELIDVPTVDEKGTYRTPVVPRADLDDDQVDRYWRLFGKYPNDFAAAVNKLLPKSKTFVTYDHLNNILTYES